MTTLFNDLYTLKNTSDYVLKVVNRWADEFKVPTENIIHLNK